MRSLSSILSSSTQARAFCCLRMRSGDEWRVWHRWQRSRIAPQLARAQMSSLEYAEGDRERRESEATLDEHGGRGTGGPWQYILALATVAIFICYADRSNISVAILEMQKQFGWDESYTGTVLGIFFLGYAGTQLIGGSLADRYGGKLVLATGVVAWSAFTFLTPDAAVAGSVTLISCRIAMGFGEGIAFPAVHSIISAAVPARHTSSVVAIVTAASYAGMAASAGAAPWIIENFSWPMVFYSFGASALLWLPFWLATSVPHRLPEDAAGNGVGNCVPDSQSRLVPESEDLRAAQEDAMELSIDNALAESSRHANGRDQVLGHSFGLDRAFWALVQRREVWAICVAQYCQSWGMYTLFNWLPTFFNEEYQVDIQDLGKYTLLPYLMQALVGGFSGYIADVLIDRGTAVRTTRRTLQVAGMLGPALCLGIAVSPVGTESAQIATSLITVAQSLSALTLGAVSVSQLDIAPRHAGAIFGLGNTFATLSGFLSVRLTGDILKWTHSWPLVFTVASAHYVVGAVVWFAWVGSDVLPEDEW